MVSEMVTEPVAPIGAPSVAERLTRHEAALRHLAKLIDEITARIDPADFKEWVRANAEAHRRLDDLEELERKRASFHAAAEKFAR